MSFLNRISFVVLLLQVLRFGASMIEYSESEGLRASKKALMKSLGLKHLPLIAPIQSDFLLRRYSAPKFMMGLFEEVSNELRYSHGVGFHVNTTHAHYEDERKYLDDAEVDTVISFFKYDDDKSWDRVNQDFKIKFQTNFDFHEDIVHGGEFKIYKRLPRNSSMIHGNCTISVYLIPPEGKTPELLDTRDVHAWTSGWHTFNVTAALKLWAHFPLTNHGLRIVVHHVREDLSPRSFGIVGTRGSLDKRPYLVGFVTTTRVLPTFRPQLPTSRERRASRDRWRAPAAASQEDCELKKFVVDFKKIGLHRTIIAPKAYDMFFCEGRCMFPIDSTLDGTNHATIQSLLHIADNNIPSPCCAPGKLAAINLLFYDEKGNVLLKKHPGMVARSCVCH